MVSGWRHAMVLSTKDGVYGRIAVGHTACRIDARAPCRTHGILSPTPAAYRYVSARSVGPAFRSIKKRGRNSCGPSLVLALYKVLSKEHAPCKWLEQMFRRPGGRRLLPAPLARKRRGRSAGPVLSHHCHSKPPRDYGLLLPLVCSSWRLGANVIMISSTGLW